MRESRIQNGQLYALAGDRWRPAELRECLYCGKQFPFILAQMSHRNKGTFCSRACMGLTSQKKYSAHRPTRICIICGTHFKVLPSRVQRYRTCSKACSSIYKHEYLIAYHERKRSEESGN